MTTDDAASARTVIEQIWYRARINAFAQRAAQEECSEAAYKHFRGEIVATLLAILLIVVVYLSGQLDPEVLPYSRVIALGATFGSISFTLYALYQSVMGNYQKYEVRAARHGHLLNLYQFIAQRAREVKWTDLPGDDVVALLKDLERDFALLKATGAEPADRHFDIAHAVVKKIQGENEAKIAQSFPLNIVQDAQMVGIDKADAERVRVS